MENDKIVININDKNDTKSNIVYDNVLSNMDNMNISQNEQIEYLKSRITDLEKLQKQRYDFIILGLSAFFALVIGVTFMILNFYFAGILIIFSTCFISCFHTFKLSNNKVNSSVDKFEKIDEIRKIISSKLKWYNLYHFFCKKR